MFILVQEKSWHSYKVFVIILICYAISEGPSYFLSKVTFNGMFILKKQITVYIHTSMCISKAIKLQENKHNTQNKIIAKHIRFSFSSACTCAAHCWHFKLLKPCVIKHHTIYMHFSFHYVLDSDVNILNSANNFICITSVRVLLLLPSSYKQGKDFRS